MSRDEIAQMMQDTAGANWGTEAHFQRFAALVAAEIAKCGECGKSAAEGWALYCVQCYEGSMVAAAVAEEREATISKIESEICHAEINNLRLASLFGQRQGPLAVRVDSLAAVVDAIRARGQA